MKILHTADWHLGNTFHNYSRTLEHKHFLSWLINVIKKEQPDALIVSGDIFDTSNPSAVAEELLYDFLLHATLCVPGLQIVLIAGNHDSASRLEAPAALLKTHNIYVRGAIHCTEKGEPDFDYYLLPLADRQTGQAACVCMAVPYLRGGDYPIGMTPEEGLRYFFKEMHQHLNNNSFKDFPTIVVAHFYAAGAEVCESEHSERLVVGGQECVSADVLGKNICYAALGHIHKAQRVGGGSNVFYAGSALPMSFSELTYRHGIQCVTIDERGRTEVSRIEYTPLRKLMTIPSHGKIADTAQVFEEIAQLPNKQKGDKGDNWQYLEIRIAEKQPEPTLLHDVLVALQDKAVHYCRMVRVRTSNKEKLDVQKVTSETLSSIKPLDMAQKYFKSLYDNEMPEELVKRFKVAEAAALKEQTETIDKEK